MSVDPLRALLRALPAKQRAEIERQLRATTAPSESKSDGRYGFFGPKRQGVRPSREPYTRDEIIRAIRRCARELGVEPSSSTYEQWAISCRAEGRKHGRPERIPRAYQMYRHFPASEGGYRAALTAARVDADELIAAKARRFGIDVREIAPSAEEHLKMVSDNELSGAGLDREAIRVIRVGKIGKLDYSQAVSLARHLGVSMEWLAGATLHPGEPPANDERFDGRAFELRRRQRGIERGEVRRQLRLDEGRYRRLINGKFEPTLHEASLLARLLPAIS